MHQKLVSVIIPTYNRAHLVVEAIESVKAQSYPTIQVIVADDGSQDDTAQSVAKVENVEYYYQENKGQAAARNLGLRYAKGEYIASLDSDDIWHKDFLKVAVAALEQYQADFVFLNWTEISEAKQSVQRLGTKQNMAKVFQEPGRGMVTVKCRRSSGTFPQNLSGAFFGIIDSAFLVRCRLE
ncbi:MAG: glycosyltransferase family 2 protein [Pyrinomonadaceae bacterium]